MYIQCNYVEPLLILRVAILSVLSNIISQTSNKLRRFGSATKLTSSFEFWLDSRAGCQCMYIAKTGVSLAVSVEKPATKTGSNAPTN